MATDSGKTDDKKDDKGTGDGGEEKLTAGTLRKWIKDEIGEAVKGLVPGNNGDNGSKDGDSGKGDSGKGNPEDVRGLVQAELARLQRHKDREARDKEIDDRLKNLEKEPEEKAPVERSRLHKFMGWGE